ncbi:hypothetical protein HPB52_007830 [Rhipicephalus sanguineus]|uniref:Uncharacterized protein n=1 Tax=Rhipicephalus sanguineus TaxID=34632 RepID=A0A9D4Q9D8_RHISA|nr:hypothetical protein HPB52_007830 [Rhipicephalus sanguineus]
MDGCHPSSFLPQDLELSESKRKCLDDARNSVPSCKRSATGICDLIDHVTACNKALWCLGLQIRNDPRDEHGQFSVVVIRRLRSVFLGSILDSDPGMMAVAVLLLLFAQHRCIVAVHMFDVVARNQTVLCGLRQIGTLKRLTILVDPDEQPDGVDGLIRFLRSVVVTGGLHAHFISGDYSPNYRTSLLHKLLRRRDCILTVLDLTGLVVKSNRANTLVTALGRNNSVTELAVGSHIFAPNCRETTKHFVWYLTEKKATLRKLLLDASQMNPDNTREWLRTLIGAVSEMTSLVELTARWLCEAVDIGLFGSVVALSKSLRSLDVRYRQCCDRSAHQSHNRPLDVSVIEPWLSGLKTNRTLERLTVDLSLYTPDECSLFIDAIAVNGSIVTVTVRNIADNSCLQAVYATVRDRKIQRRVLVEDHHVGLKDVQELSLYPEARAVTLSSLHFPEPSVLCTAIRALAACRHVTSLRLRFSTYDDALYRAAADYVATASTVKDIELYLNGLREETGQNRIARVDQLIGALASNRNLHKLKVHVERLTTTCCKYIADLILGNRMLYELSLEALDEQSCAMFLRLLLPGLPHNYSLLVATLPAFRLSLDAQMATLHDVTRRNRRLVDLASRFVTRDHRDASTKSALSLVSEHPKLLETVAQKKGITESEAKSMIKHSMPLPSFSDIEKWMSAVLP